MAQRCTYCGRTKRQHFGKACVDKVGLAKAIAHMAPQIALECQHGSLARSCEICERDHRIAALEEVVREFLSRQRYGKNITKLEDNFTLETECCFYCGSVEYDGFEIKHNLRCETIKARAVLEGK